MEMIYDEEIERLVRDASLPIKHDDEINNKLGFNEGDGMTLNDYMSSEGIDPPEEGDNC